MMPLRNPTSLADQQTGFKTTLKRNSSLILARPRPSNLQDALRSVKYFGNKMKRKLIMEPSPIEKESSNPMMSEIVNVVNHLKHVGHPIKTSLLTNRIGISIDGMLLELLRLFTKFLYSEEDDTFEYVSLYGIKDEKTLVQHLKLISETSMKKLDYKDLKEGWNEAHEVVTQLEKESKLLVYRKSKGQIVSVWHNDKAVDEGIQKLWTTFKLPEPSTLPRILSNAGLKAAGVDPTTDKVNSSAIGGIRERKKPRKRSGRGPQIETNTHIGYMMEDYSRVHI